ncbi:hypothetical protein D9M69_638970 [compost metagenome]
MLAGCEICSPVCRLKVLRALESGCAGMLNSWMVSLVRLSAGAMDGLEAVCASADAAVQNNASAVVAMRPT